MQKTNPWMLSTIFLVGLVIGFSIGRFIPSTDVQTSIVAEKNNTRTVPDTTNADRTRPATADTITRPAEISVTIPKNDYSPFKAAVMKDGHWTMGSPTAKVKIEEFTDFQCPFCANFFNQSYSKLLENYVATGKVYYIFYNFPLLDIHPQARKAAEAAHCAGDQKKYWEMHDLLFLNQNAWSFQETDLQTYELLAQNLKLDITTFKNCLNTDKYSNLIEKDLELGDKKGVSGTPTLFVNDTKVVGAQPYATFAKAIDEALAK